MTHRFLALLLALVIGVGWSVEAPAASRKDALSAAQTTPVDLNSATQVELEGLPGIGATRAQAIIAGRPYTSVDDLISKGILTKTLFDKIKGSVVVGAGGAKPSEASKKPASPAKSGAAGSPAVSGLVDLNTATADELDGLPGIGATRADAIIAGRPYAKVDELVSKGIVSQSIFDKIKDGITISGAAKPAIGAAASGLVDLNTASADDLDALPGIGASRAEAIIAGRPYAQADDLVTKGIVSQSVFDKMKDAITVAAGGDKSGKAKKSAGAAEPAGGAGAPAGLIDLNTASEDDLNSLPGIGATRTKAIIAGRPYAQIGDLVSKGIVSQSIFDKIKGNVTVSAAVAKPAAAPKSVSPAKSPDATPAGLIDLNTATANELEGLPGIGATRAQAIIAGRPYGKVDDLTEKGVVSATVLDKIRSSVTVSVAAAKPAAQAEEAVPPEPTGLVDLNEATADELDGLSGIGATRSAAIIAARPYKSTDELVSKGVLSQKVFDGIKDRVEVSGPAVATGQKPTGGQAAMYQRIRACGAEWRKDKAAGKIASEQTWPQFWSDCNKQLKAKGL